MSMEQLIAAARVNKAWPFQEAQRLLKRYPDGAKPDGSPILFETGYGPSGLPHIGTFQEVLRTTLVRRAFEAVYPGPVSVHYAMKCNAVPAVIAAVRRAGLEAEVWILYGDGSAAFSLAEFDTFVRHDLPVIAVVGNDASWAQIARDQVELFNDDVGTVLDRSHYQKVFEGFGGRGLLLEKEEQIPEILQEARELLLVILQVK